MSVVEIASDQVHNPAYTMSVVEIGSGQVHNLPPDAVTRDTDGARFPLVPLAFRPLESVFFVSSLRWPALAGKPLRRAAG